MSTTAKDILNGITKGISTGFETAKQEIEANKTDEPSKVSLAANKAVSAIKSAGSSVTSNVKEAIAAATERTELWETNLAGFDMSNLKFYKDSSNVEAVILEPGSIFNSELLIMSDISGKKAIGLPNIYMREDAYGYFNAELLAIWEEYFEIECQESEIESDFYSIPASSITDIVPAELKFRGTYCELCKKGKLSVIPVILEEEDFETEAPDEADTEAEAEPEAKAEAEAEPEPEAEAETKSNSN